MRVPILYQDEDIVVVDKPAGLPTHAAEPGDPYHGDALRIVQGQLGLRYLGMHQRLDAETSGVLLFAARREANAPLAAAFAGHAVHKTYLALVCGRPEKHTGTIDAPIAREHGDRYRVARQGEAQAQSAVTHYRLLETDPTGRYSLLEVHPETGRSHQIRVHLAFIGVPVVGDALYAPGRRGSSPRPSGPTGASAGHVHSPAPRLGLHAYRLALPHPRTGQSVTFTAPPPPLFTRVAMGLPELKLAAATLHVLELGGKEAGLSALIDLAVGRRAPLAADSGTTIYRLINGAADGLAGMTADRYGDALVVNVYDNQKEGWGENGRAPGDNERPISVTSVRAALPAIVLDTLATAAGARSIYVKYRPRQASRVGDAELAELAPSIPIIGPALGECVAYEEGLAYLVRPGEGWNPGLFPDMREMRARVRAWASGRTVLNCFAYTCGFGLAATAGGAAHVLNLDLSKPALARGQANYQANGFAFDPHDFVYGDALDWLNRLARRGEKFQLVILDPPGFARTKTRRFSAEHDYGELAALAAGVTAPDGMIVACSNVAELSWRTFRDRVLAGLSSAGLTFDVAGVFHAPPLDYPTPTGREGHLKILVARVG
jgi:23S rRNA (cytosine1962-C5)-methyltransferase